MAGASSSSGLGRSDPPAEALVTATMMGRYAPVARLGKGGMADVFLTVAHGLQGVNKLAVVKRLRNAGDAALTEMLLDEARLGARLNHPNIVHTYDAGEVDGEYFIAMEYLEGQPLSRVLKTLEERCEGLREPLVAFIAIEALKGLHYAHEFCDFDGSPLGVVHRDVSPHNLFVTYGGEIKLLDFGIAKASLNAAHTEDGVLKGKVRYMAPEQASQGDLDRRVDLYAFGIVLWEMLARRPLFSGPPVQILNRILNEDVPPVRGVRPDVSPALEAIALKAVRRDRDERYASAEEMRVDLEAYLREQRDTVSERELARTMNALFASIRDDVRARIKAHVASMPARSATISGAAGITSTGKLPVLPTWGHLGGPPSWPAPAVTDVAGDVSTQSRAAPDSAVRRSSRLPLALVIVLALVAIAGAAPFVLPDVLHVQLPWREDAPPPSSVALAPGPSAARAEAPATGGVGASPGASSPPPALATAAASVTPPGATSARPPASAERPPATNAHAPPAPARASHSPASTPPSPAAPRAAASPAPEPSASSPARPNIRMLDDSSP